MTNYYDLFDKLKIDESKELREDLTFLWDNKYVTVFSCAGYECSGEIISTPYISIVCNSGNGEWESRAKERKWELSEYFYFDRTVFSDNEMSEFDYYKLVDEFGSIILLSNWIKHEVLN